MVSPAAQSLAWVDYNGVRYFARECGHRFSPETPVTRLIEGVYAELPDQALWILRHRIYASYPISDLCRSAVAVAAKRVTSEMDWGTPPDCLHEVLPAPRASTAADAATQSEPLLPHDWINRALELTRTIPQDVERFRSHRQVAALAVSPLGKELGRATNTNGTNKIRHAEMNLLWDLSARNLTPLPPGTVLYVTLKPCRMCAAAIAHCADDPGSISVLYAQEDEGPLSRNTILDRLGVVRRLEPTPS